MIDSREEKYPLYPELSDAGKEEAQQLLDRFKTAMKKAAEEVLGSLYSDVIPHIESDSWDNYRNAMMDGFLDYRNRHVQGQYEFKRIRQKIFSEFRAEIIEDLNQDHLAKIDELQKEISRLLEIITERPHGRY